MISKQPPYPEEDQALPFPGYKGRSVRVAVIDSGVNTRHPHIAGIVGGVCVGVDPEIGEESYSDFLGHGTAVMAAIQEKAPEAQYFAAKLFHASLRTRTDCLLKAIEWAIEHRMDVVNLSLGTRNPDHAERFMAVVARGVECGVTLVSAREADGQRCFPGCLPDVLSVGLDWDCNRNRYRCEDRPDGVVFYASGYPRSLPGMPRERNLHGISFAVANMTGFIVRACEGLAQRSPETIREALLTEAARVNSPAAQE
jgi:hypothetical protein